MERTSLILLLLEHRGNYFVSNSLATVSGVIDWNRRINEFLVDNVISFCVFSPLVRYHFKHKLHPNEMTTNVACGVKARMPCRATGRRFYTCF